MVQYGEKFAKIKRVIKKQIEEVMRAFSFILEGKASTEKQQIKSNTQIITIELEYKKVKNSNLVKDKNPKIKNNEKNVSLPNEENIHLRLGFLSGRGINRHGLEMYGKHVNHRHLWLIQISKAEKILKNIAEAYDFEMVQKSHYIAYPTTKWKRVIYKLGMLFLPWSVKSRNFILLFRKK